jgi:drug/metabolite transporter (DMT)-like permease
MLPFAAILAAPLLWAIGTMRSRGAPRHSPLLASAMQMIIGGALLIALGTAQGEWNEFHPASVSQRSLTAFVYLVVMGSIVAFSAYTWLIRVASPSAVSTYAYVNPLVAVLLGWGIGDEAISMNMLVATPLIVGAVATITLRRRPRMQLQREPDLKMTGTRAVISPARAE